MRRALALVLGLTLVSSVFSAGAAVALADGARDRPAPNAKVEQEKDEKGNEVEGAVTGITGTNIGVQTKAGAAVDVVTGAGTVFTREKQPASLPDVHTGDKVEAKGSTNADGTFAATLVQIKLPKMEGQVTGLSGNDVAVQTKDGLKTVHTGESTIFIKSKQPATLADVVGGVKIKAKGTLDPDGSLTAFSIEIKAPKPGK